MKQIKVSYRAVFSQPIGTLNPSGYPMPGDIPVEVFQATGKWCAREISTPARGVFKKLGNFPSADSAKTGLENAFKWRRQAWQTWGILPAVPGVSTTVERMLEPHEIQTLQDGKVLWKEADDYLHIIHAPTLRPGEKIPHAACGAKVKASSFVNTRANIEPTCKVCAAAWKEHYQGKYA